MKIDGQVNGYDIDVIVIGYPGKTVCHGGLGWSTIVLLRGHGRVAHDRYRRHGRTPAC